MNMNVLHIIGLSTLVLMLLHHNMLLQWQFVQNKYHRRLRRWWVRSVNQSKRRHGFQHNLYRELMNTDHEEFYAAMRMRPAQFIRLVDLVTPYLRKFCQEYGMVQWIIQSCLQILGV